MIKHVITLFISMLILNASTRSYADENKKIMRVYFDTPDQVEVLISMDLDMADVITKRYADVVVTSSQESTLRNRGFQLQPLIDDVERALYKAGLFTENMGDYHTYQEMVDELTQTAAAFPHISRLISIGKSIEGRDIWAIKVSDYPESEDDSEPDLLYMANMHAREIITPEIILYFLQHLVSNYEIDSDITYLVDNLEFWLIPTQNPDGHVYVEEIDQWWRKNRRDNGNGTFGVDLNRNYGYMWGYNNAGSSSNTSAETYRGKSAFSEPESQVIRKLCIEHNFILSLSYHSYGNWWLFPWGYIAQNTEDHDIFLEIALDCVAYNGYVAGNGAMGVIYETNGDTDDYFYGEQTEKNKMFGFTPEVGTTFFPPEEDIPQLVAENLGPNLYIAHIAPIMADNPRRILRPAIPVFAPVSYIAEGCFDLKWTINDDPDNIAVAFDVEEIENLTLIPDDMEGDELYWTLNGFDKNTNRYHSNAHSLYSSTGDNINHTAMLTTPFIVPENTEFTFWTWYDIERNWDYAYVELSADGGKSFASIPGNITTQYDPYGENLGYGITGKSSEWVKAIFELGDYAGQTIMLRIRYVTDTYMSNEGIYIDDIDPVSYNSGMHLIAADFSNSKLRVTKSDTGTYHYRIRSIDNEGQTSYWSPLIAVSIDSANTGGSKVYLSPDSVSAYPDETIRLSINIDDAPVSIDTFSVTLRYDSLILSYSTFKPAAVESTSVTEIAPGELVIFGYTDIPIAAGKSDSLLTLEFTTKQELYDSPITLSQPEYDIETMALDNSWFTAPPCKLGDVNYDGAVTPDDALSAFHIYLYYPADPYDVLNLNHCSLESADMNCTPNGITPGDALHILRAYLNGENPPLDCIDVTSSQTENDIILTLKQRIMIADDMLSIPLHITANGGISSFGLSVKYSAAALEFTSIRKSDSFIDWPYFDSAKLNDGAIRIGGFSSEVVNDINDEVLLNLEFKLKQGSSSNSFELELTDLKDDFLNAKTEIMTALHDKSTDGDVPQTLILEQNYPNPFNMRTIIRFQLPTKGDIELTIYNALGQPERRLLCGQQEAGSHAIVWDGRNDSGSELASGLYFCELKNSASIQVRKLLILK
ncbi:immune inhibitor A [candidate division KSB1 bacterium]|nr:immune inhibitor A [candidate division KSB1 bacterium]